MAQRKGNGRGEARAAQAKRHIEQMESRYGAEIKASAEAMRVYDGMPAAKTAAPAAADVDADAGAAEPKLPTVTVVDQDSVSAVLDRGRGIASACDLAVLNFASFVSPGGGYERGAWAQEEALCSESTLYNVLATKRSWYAENRRRHINCELYRNRGLVAPRIRFERDGYHSYADVITVAAPYARRARENYHVAEKTLVSAMRERIRFVLAIADDLGHKKLVLGAFGCGVFGWDAKVVAPLFLEELASGAHVAEEVVFAVPRGRYDENLECFEHAFAKFPEVNDDVYVTRAEREAAAAASAAAAAADDDEDEDDWRKYL